MNKMFGRSGSAMATRLAPRFLGAHQSIIATLRLQRLVPGLLRNASSTTSESAASSAFEQEDRAEDADIWRVLVMEELTAKRAARLKQQQLQQANATVTEQQQRIRNFCILAHVDHGKSTLADRLLQTTKAVREDVLARQAQFLDDMDLERERGITIKLRSARMNYTDPRTGEAFILNLIDTPGHVDFGYEVSRSLAAVEGALLVVDASQGIQAQTLANVDLALKNGLEIIPVLNKIDLPGAQPEKVLQQMVDVIGIDPTLAVFASAKQGVGIDEILNRIVDFVPPPGGAETAPLQALVFDSYYDVYRGVIALIRVVNGKVRKGDRIKMMSNNKEYVVDAVGLFTPAQVEISGALGTGEVGFLSANVKSVGDAAVGDTMTTVNNSASCALPGYRKNKPVVFASMFPCDSSGDGFANLQVALSKFTLSDSSLTFEPIFSSALGNGFRCGFNGLLHMDIVQERLDREFGMDVLLSAPNVVYRVRTRSGDEHMISNPSDIDPAGIAEIQEPMAKVDIIAPQAYQGALEDLVRNRRSTMIDLQFLDGNRIRMLYRMPLSEIISDFHSNVLARTKGYGSMDFCMDGYEASELVRVDIALQSSIIDGFAFIEHVDFAASRGRALAQRLKDIIPRHMFKVAIQAKIGAKVIASESIAPFRKDVTAKCYGGDITRKQKLLKKQAAGKKRMKLVGTVSLPQEAFRKIIASD
ncbi:Elongation factor 4 [Porphyridium purpureum]|uniref:Translation factor GUF1 homolog, mitochondrial n=1 Tax=Porphyridium purpureum TaxID=35688 RepID=A0A5J4YRH9_PORPP|nr:Elongation factor 4 [Porphyridium purpureum]|eukprot:POR4591..scf229_5